MMDIKKGMIVNKNSLYKSGEYAKEEYEGIIVCSDTKRGLYNIAIQLDEDQVLIVDQVKDTEVHQRLNSWVPYVTQIQREYSVDMEMQSYV
ncbi:MAG: hypothetical protein ACOX0E_09130 [Syntrophomonadaceae bacterium]|jgi:hypothetical protein